MTPLELSSLGGLALSVVALVVLPLVFRRQTANQLKAQQAIAEIKERAEHDAAVKTDKAVSWEQMNRALATTAQEERAAHREELAGLRLAFAADIARLKQLTDYDLDRAKEEIGRARDENRKLDDQVQALNRQIAGLTSPSGK